MQILPPTPSHRSLPPNSASLRTLSGTGPPSLNLSRMRIKLPLPISIPQERTTETTLGSLSLTSRKNLCSLKRHCFLPAINFSAHRRRTETTAATKISCFSTSVCPTHCQAQMTYFLIHFPFPPYPLLQVSHSSPPTAHSPSRLPSIHPCYDHLQLTSPSPSSYSRFPLARF